MRKDELFLISVDIIEAMILIAASKLSNAYRILGKEYSLLKASVCIWKSLNDVSSKRGRVSLKIRNNSWKLIIIPYFKRLSYFSVVQTTNPGYVSSNDPFRLFK